MRLYKRLSVGLSVGPSAVLYIALNEFFSAVSRQVQAGIFITVCCKRKFVLREVALSGFYCIYKVDLHLLLHPIFLFSSSFIFSYSSFFFSFSSFSFFLFKILILTKGKSCIGRRKRKQMP
jgi:hypothetical protein